MKLKDLVKGLNVLEVEGDMDVEIKDIAYDSRKAKAGSLFVCIEGFKVDGHKFIPQAIENGTRAFLVQKDVDVPMTRRLSGLRIQDMLLPAWPTFFRAPSSKFNLVGITGTKGKTTTTYMIKSILEAFGQKVGLVGTIANMIGHEVLPTDRTTPEVTIFKNFFQKWCKKT